MRILLLLPYDGTYRYGGFMRRSLTYAPLTLTTLAAMVPASWAATLDLIDEGIQPNPSATQHYDVVGISCVTSAAPRAYELARYWRQRGAYVVLGGAHPTLVPEEAAAHADAVIAGPAEEAWPRLLDAYRAGRPLRGVVRRDPAASQACLAPRRELLPRGRYLGVPTVIASRGCANRCDFCAINHVWQRQRWARPVAEVVDEIRHLGARRILFLDPNLVTHRGYALELFRALEPLKLKWGGLATLGLSDDDELLDAAARSGCQGLLAGFESLSQEALDHSRKTFNRVEHFARATARFHERRISLLGTFVLGFDTDTVADLRQLPEQIDALGVDLPRFAILTPFPGTALHQRLQREGRITSTDLRLYDCEHVVFQPARMTAQELETTYAEVWRQAYALKRVARRVWRDPADRLLALASNLGFRHYGRSLSQRWAAGPYPVDPAVLVPLTAQATTDPGPVA